MKTLAACAVLTCLISAPAQAQTVTNPIDQARRADWTQAGVPGGIPNRTTVCATLNSGATANQINSAIASCPSGQVVQLNAGTYTLSAGINFANRSNVTLRGAGADKTMLVFTGGVGCMGPEADVCVPNADVSYAGGPTHAANWTGGYTRGATSITLSSTAGLTVGGILILDQLNDASDTGNVYVSSSPAVASDGPAGSARPDRDQQQVVKVAAINGNTVTITPGLYLPNWRASQSPGAWGPNTTVSGVGIEDLSLDHTNSLSTAGIMFANAYGCWVKGVKDVNSNRSHVWLYETARTTVRDSYFYGTKDASSQSYGVEFFTTSDNLVENNIFQHIVAGVIFNGGDGGSVVAYNYSTDDFYTVSAGWMMASAWLHASGTSMELFEGNDGAGIIMDTIHGTHNFTTMFRNYWLGWETGKSAQTIPIHLYAYSRYMNAVGNVLGKSGYHTNYESATPSGVNADTSNYVLGWSGNEGEASPSGIANDPLVKTTLMRWGNYDAATAAPVWNNTEVPTGLSLFANALPASRVLPASMYLAAKPAWWGAGVWPPVGPDVTGGALNAGLVHKIAARRCFESSTKNASGILNFKASACYLPTATTSTAPRPPTNVRIIR
jgi:hypothetical protein